MIYFVLGKPKSGKSIYVENILADESQVLYVGTIPNDYSTKDTIELHRKRRPKSWGLYECTGEIEEDCPKIIQLAKQATSVLIDGLSYYIVEGIYYKKHYDLSSIKLIISFLRVFRRSNCNCYIIDHYACSEECVERIWQLLLHKLIMKYANNTFLFKNNNLFAYSGSEVI